MDAMHTALSGLNAASLRLKASADNIANAQSTRSRDAQGVVTNTPYQPVRVTQSSQRAGGTSARLEPVNPATTPVNDPENSAADANGITQYPNVSLEKEFVNIITAVYDFKANLKVLKVKDELDQSLLDIKA